MSLTIGRTRRQFLTGAAAAALPLASHALPAGEVTPEMFGAKGDGRSNDTAAFVAMSDHINSMGGGTIVLRPVTYVVGKQRRSATGKAFSFEPSDIIHLTNCDRPIVINGNGAKLRAASALRYGRFDPASGKPLPDPAKIDLTDAAVPYSAMVHILNCSGSVSISDLELDGNLDSMWIGGKAAPGGWEAGGSGMWLYENSGPERLSRIYSHHHPADGFILTPEADRIGSTSVTDAVCEWNGRQGCSVTGGSNFSFQRCKFRRSGRIIPSAPGAGVDIEAESSRIRNVAFWDCEFSDNYGFGVVSGSGDSADMRFEDCKFVGTTNYAAWPDSPQMRFTRCLFVGSVNHVHGDPDAARATQFVDCTFTDDPNLSPNGNVYLAPGLKWILLVPQSLNSRFKNCRFHLVGDAILPLSTADVVYDDCNMSQRSPQRSAPIGTYVATNRISGNADVHGSVVRGALFLNGRMYQPPDG